MKRNPEAPPSPEPDQPGAAAPAETFYTEKLPSQPGQTSSLASATAPFLYFDGAPIFHHAGGIGMVTITAARYIAVKPNGEAPCDHVVVGHLRGGLAAMTQLHHALGKILEAASAEAATAADTAAPTSTTAH